MTTVQKESSKCTHEMIGRGMIEHDGIKHPGGEQICLDCGMTLKEILESVRTQAMSEGYKQGRFDAMADKELLEDNSPSI